ncbi:MAG: hypothetical protein ACKPKO_14605, partial [Candidatus Fonsibacter sp.]
FAYACFLHTYTVCRINCMKKNKKINVAVYQKIIFKNINLHCLRNMLVCESKNRKNIKIINSII